MADDAKGFWSTLPGIITGTAGLVTAVAGLVGALYTAGVVGHKGDPPKPAPVEAASVVPAKPVAAVTTETTTKSPPAGPAVDAPAVTRPRPTEASLTGSAGGGASIAAPRVGRLGRNSVGLDIDYSVPKASGPLMIRVGLRTAELRVPIGAGTTTVTESSGTAHCEVPLEKPGHRHASIAHVTVSSDGRVILQRDLPVDITFPQ